MVDTRHDPTLNSAQRIAILRKWATVFPDIRVFVESGTADGETLIAMSDLFDRMHTIEIVPSVYIGTQKKIKTEFPHITNVDFWLGDSMTTLPHILHNIENAPSFFWLDGHYCGSIEARGALDTPIVQELEIIMATDVPHVIFVDDARLFGRDPAYPSVDWVRNFVTDQNVEYSFAYEDDMMRILPVRR